MNQVTSEFSENRQNDVYVGSRSEFGFHDYKVTAPGFEQSIHFQEGPVKEVGVNGVTNEDLIEVVMHRLHDFQMGPFKSVYNLYAISALNGALQHLDKRTQERKQRGVEGTNVV
jgi:hypothetical protein